jgi:hypothetical protein
MRSSNDKKEKPVKKGKGSGAARSGEKTQKTAKPVRKAGWAKPKAKKQGKK